MLLAFGSENDPNSNCSSLAWSTSCPSSSYKLYPRNRDKRISLNAVAGKTHAASASEMHISLHDYIDKNTLVFWCNVRLKSIALAIIIICVRFPFRSYCKQLPVIDD